MDEHILPAANLPENAAVFQQTGDKNTQIAHANNVNNVNNVINIIVSAQRPTGGVIDTRFALCTEYYNLFVVGDETFADGHFTVPKDRALTESMSLESKAPFTSLGDDAVSQIKTFPSLFASENHQYGKTDAVHQAYFGVVTDVKIQDNGIKVYFILFSSIPQQRLNEIAHKLALQGASLFNELNRTHWAIKKINLIEVLRAAGISVLAPT